MKRKHLTRFLAGMMALIMSLCFNTSLAFAEEETSNGQSQIVEVGDRIYYLASGEEASADNYDVWTSKTIEETGSENEFEITLQVGTTMKAIPNDVAVVLVMDASGSMLTDAGGKKWGNWGSMPTDGRKLRIDYLKEAALEFAESYAENAGNSKRMLAMVEFGNNAYTCLPWTNVNDNGTLHEDAEAAIEAVNVSFVYDNRSFWNEEEMLSTYLYPGPNTEKVQQKVEFWSDEEYVHEAKNYFESHFQSFVDEHGQCTYEGCQSTAADHKHCTVCGVTDEEMPEHMHCAYEGCTITENHAHCTYAICSNPGGHEHCERVCWCDEDHEHCEDLMAVCGRTDEHTHVTGCTMTGCQDTTPNHRHACTYGSEGDYPYCDMYGGYYNIETARCLNPDPNHTHDVHDGDTAYTIFDRNWQGYYAVGTNMEGGLLLARNLLNSGLADGGAIEGIDDVYVIILSDGNPTWHVDQSVETDADTEVTFVGGQRGTRSCDWADICDIVYDEQATDIASDMAIAEDIKAMSNFYAVLYGTELNNKLGGSHSMSSVTGANWFKTKNDLSADPEIRNYIGADLVLESPEIDGLDNVFSNIKDRIDILAKAWIVTDELSNEVTFDSFIRNGEYAALNDEETTISWNLGRMEPENPNAAGTVEDPYIYTLKYRVTLNPDAEGVYEASAENIGVNTNKAATLCYIMTEGDEKLSELSYEELQERLKEVVFAHPAVKAFYADYEFTKLLVNDDSVLANIGFTLYKNGEVWGEEVFSDENGKVRFERISAGEYKLCETTVPDRVLYMTPIEFVVSYGKISTVAGSEMPEVIYNSSEQRIITFYKTAKVVENSEESPRPLEGIEFKIYYLCSVEEYNQKLQTGEITESNAIEKLEREHVATVATDKGGKAMYNLTENQQPDGIYLIVELEHDAIEKPVDPFLVAVPGTKKETGEPVYVVDITPKNVPVKPDIKKDVMKPSYDMGENVTWIIQGDIPKDMAKALSYVITDQLDERLTYVGNVVVKAEKIDAAKVKPVAETGLLVGTDYTLNVKGNSIKIELTKEGRAKVAEQVGADYADYELRVYFDTYIDADAAMGEAIPNDATLEYINSANFKWVVLPEKKPEVYTTGINVHKYDAKDNTKALSGAVFKLAEVVDKDTAGAVPLVIKNAEGKVESVYAVYKEFYIDAACTTKANTVTTNAEGNALLYGLEAGTYYLVETKAPAGYNLLSYPVKVSLDKTSHVKDNPATLDVNEDRTVYVANSNTFVLPETGGIGTAIFTLAGSLMMGGAGVMLINKKRDEE